MWGHESILDKNWGGFSATTRRENFRSLSETRAVHPKNPTRGALKRSKIQVWKLSIGIRPQHTAYTMFSGKFWFWKRNPGWQLEKRICQFFFVRNHNKCDNRFQKSLLPKWWGYFRQIMISIVISMWIFFVRKMFFWGIL